MTAEWGKTRGMSCLHELNLVAYTRREVWLRTGCEFDHSCTETCCIWYFLRAGINWLTKYRFSWQPYNRVFIFIQQCVAEPCDATSVTHKSQSWVCSDFSLHRSDCENFLFTILSGSDCEVPWDTECCDFTLNKQNWIEQRRHHGFAKSILASNLEYWMPGF